jgi:hypothetical protein
VSRRPLTRREPTDRTKYTTRAGVPIRPTPSLGVGRMMSVTHICCLPFARQPQFSGQALLVQLVNAKLDALRKAWRET